jgi:hypothetical protein
VADQVRGLVVQTVAMLAGSATIRFPVGVEVVGPVPHVSSVIVTAPRLRLSVAAVVAVGRVVMKPAVAAVVVARAVASVATVATVVTLMVLMGAMGRGVVSEATVAAAATHLHSLARVRRVMPPVQQLTALQTRPQQQVVGIAAVLVVRLVVATAGPGRARQLQLKRPRPRRR